MKRRKYKGQRVFYPTHKLTKTMEAALSLKKKLEGEGKKVAIVQPYVPVKITKELYEFQDMEVLIHALLFETEINPVTQHHTAERDPPPICLL